jgi:hypothetical protein
MTHAGRKEWIGLGGDRAAVHARIRPSTARERAMKYLCLIYNEEKAVAAMPPQAVEAIAGECVGYDEVLKAYGQFIACERLQPTRAAATVRLRDGKASVTDGPFAETKEQLAGFYLIEARDLNEAIRIASRIPPARLGCVEVRPVWDYGTPAHAATGGAR